MAYFLISKVIVGMDYINKTVQIFVSFLLLGFAVEAKPIEEDMKKLVNYRRMNATHYKNYHKQRTAQFASWQKHKIPEHFRIPVEIQSYRGNNSIRYYGLYNAAHKTGVGYIPSNLTLLYEEEAWFAYKNAGIDAPSLSIVLAQQFTESAFNPHAIGDNNMSRGLPQLYRKTAEYLYKTDKSTWKEIFYFDKYGNHHFHNVRAMVKFPFIFLPKVKKYSANNKFDGIRRYNGSGENAIKYAEKIMVRSLYYEELFSKYNALPLDTTGFRENLFGMINLTLLSREEEPLGIGILEDLFQNALTQFYNGYVRNTFMHHYMIPVMENNPTLIAQPEDHIIPVDGKDYYLIIEDGHTLYSYFKDPQILLSTLNHSKNSSYYLYYRERKKTIKVRDLTTVGKKQVFSNVKPGDKLFIPPGTVIRDPESSFAVRIN